MTASVFIGTSLDRIVRQIVSAKLFTDTTRPDCGFAAPDRPDEIHVLLRSRATKSGLAYMLLRNASKSAFS